MAELVGLAASVVTLVANADYVRHLLINFKKGAEQRQQLLTSVTSMRTMLDDLRTTYLTRQANGRGEEWTDLVKPLEARGVFQRIDDVFAELRGKLDPQHTLSKFIVQLSWPFVKEDVDRNVRQIHDLSRDVSLVLQDISLKLAIITHDRVTRIDLREGRREQQAILDWFSTLKFIQQQEIESRRATAGTCEWFFSLETYKSWKYRRNRILYCKAIGGAGKTVLAAKAYEDLRYSTAGQDSGVFIMHLKYDQPDTHIPIKIVGALLRQSIQLQNGRMDDTLKQFLEEYYYREKAKPDVGAYMTQLRKSLEKFSTIFFVVDGLDEIKSDKSRVSMIDLLATIRPDASIMFTSRPISLIDDVFNAISVPSATPHSSSTTPVNGTGCSEYGEALETRHQACNNCDSLLCQKCAVNDTICSFGKTRHELSNKLFATILDVSARSSAIRTYVRARVEQSSHLGKWIDRRPGLSKQIQDKVVYMAQKMFLLAQLHMDAITDPDLLKESDFDRALKNLPKQLEDSYDQAMERVDAYGRSLIQIIAYANRSLTAGEIEHALGIDPLNGSLRDGDIIPVTALISRCAGLVTFNAKDYVTFSHYTIADYISETATRWFPDGHVDLFKRCLSYLQLPAFSRGAELSKEEGRAYSLRLMQFPFLDYASVYWAGHLQATGRIILYQEGLSLVTNAACFSSIVQALWYSKDLTAISWRRHANASPLEFAVFTNFSWLFNQLLTSGYPIMGSNRLKMTPLMLTAQAGNLEMTRKVLEMGCDVNAVNAESESALHLAIKGWNDDVALLLIDHTTIDINLVTGTGPKLRTPLVLAIIEGRVDVYTKLVSSTQIDLNIALRAGQTALHFAIDEEDGDAVEALLSHGNLELHNFPGCSIVPLHSTAEIGSLTITRLLLDAGTDVNIRDTKHNATALMRAADYGHVDVIQELLRRDADLEAVDRFDRHALNSAAINGQAEAADYLLANTKVNINHQDVNGNAPLHDAAGSRNLETVEVLLKHDARTDLVNKKSHRPLDIARHTQAPEELITLLTHKTSGKFDQRALDNVLDMSQFGDSDDIRRMLDKKSYALRPELEERDPWIGRTPLHHVVQRGLIDVIPILHDAGSDLNAKDSYGRTALHIGVMLGRTKIVRYLLEHGAEAEAEDIWGVAPLREAYKLSKPWTAILLVEYGVQLRDDVDIQWLLNQATWQGNLKAAHRLIEAGARVDCKLSNGMTLYDYAKKHGHTELADYLDSAGYEQTTVTVERTMKSEALCHETDQMPDIQSLKDGMIRQLEGMDTDDIGMRESEHDDEETDAECEQQSNKPPATGFVRPKVLFATIQPVIIIILAIWWSGGQAKGLWM